MWKDLKVEIHDAAENLGSEDPHSLCWKWRSSVT